MEQVFVRMRSTAIRTAAEYWIVRGTQADRALRETLLMVAGSVLVALAAQVSIPWQPVPVTLQTVAVLLVGAACGSRGGAACMAAYLLEGAAGLPVFAHGTFGVARLFGPTAGYLWSFPLAAFVVGWLVERGWDRRWFSALAALTLGNGIILATGAAWLGVLAGPSVAVRAGVLPFLSIDLLKLALAAGLLPAGRHWVDRLTRSR